MASPDQPTAPYLDAVTAYGFRGSTRFHVPGHKAEALRDGRTAARAGYPLKRPAADRPGAVRPTDP